MTWTESRDLPHVAPRPRTSVALLLGGIAIRAVGPGDAPGIARLLRGLDGEARYRRWFCSGVDLDAAVAWAAAPDPATDEGLVAMFGSELIGHAALAGAPVGRGEIAFEVDAAWRHHGVATALLEALEQCAHSRGMSAIYAEVLTVNGDMLAVLREHGAFAERREGSSLELELRLPHAVAAQPLTATSPTSTPWRSSHGPR